MLSMFFVPPKPHYCAVVHFGCAFLCLGKVGAPSPEKKLFGRRARIPVVRDVPRAAPPPPRLLFEDLEASGLPGIAVSVSLRALFEVVAGVPHGHT